MQTTSWRGLFRIGGVALIVAGISYLILIPLLMIAGGLPVSSKQLLSVLASQGLLIQSVMVIFIIKDLSALLAFPVLLIAFREVNRTWPLVATVLASVALILDIISSLVVYSLPSFSLAYLAAATPAQPAYLLAADLIFKYIWKIETPFMVILLSLAAASVSVVMLKGLFSRPTAYLGLVLGVIGVVGGLLGYIQPILLLSLWYLATGIQLYRLNQHYLSQVEDIHRGR
jgi:hypothetical protein